MSFPFNVTVFIDISKLIPVPNHHSPKAYRGVEIRLHTFLNSTLDNGEWLASWSALLNSWVKVLGTFYYVAKWAPQWAL
jgi:hypothetical protein